LEKRQCDDQKIGYVRRCHSEQIEFKQVESNKMNRQGEEKKGKAPGLVNEPLQGGRGSEKETERKRRMAREETKKVKGKLTSPDLMAATLMGPSSTQPGSAKPGNSA
jgi:hypothetical protein